MDRKKSMTHIDTSGISKLSHTCDFMIEAKMDIGISLTSVLSIGSETDLKKNLLISCFTGNKYKIL